MKRESYQYFNFEKCEKYFISTIDVFENSGNKRIVQLLLNGKVNIEARNVEGEKAANLAALCGNLDVLLFLIEQGASGNEGDTKNDTIIYKKKQLQEFFTWVLNPSPTPSKVYKNKKVYIVDIFTYVNTIKWATRFSGHSYLWVNLY